MEFWIIAVILGIIITVSAIFFVFICMDASRRKTRKGRVYGQTAQTTNQQSLQSVHSVPVEGSRQAVQHPYQAQPRIQTIIVKVPVPVRVPSVCFSYLKLTEIL